MAGSLHSRNGVALWSPQAAKGTAVTPATAVGMCGYNVTDDADVRHLFSIGQANLFKSKGGVAKVPFSLQIPRLQDKALLLRAVRDATTKTLPYSTFGFGSQDGSTSEAWQVQDCMLHQIDLSLEGNGSFLTASMQGVGGIITVLSSLNPAFLAPTPFMTYEAVMTLGGAAFEVKGFRVSVNHNVNVEAMISGAARTAGQVRLWDYQTPGFEVIEGSVSVARVKSGSFQTDAIAAAQNLVLTLTDTADGTHTFTITLGNIDLGNQHRTMPEEGWANFEMPFAAKSFSIA